MIPNLNIPIVLKCSLQRFSLTQLRAARTAHAFQDSKVSSRAQKKRVGGRCNLNRNLVKDA
jgi:hypothetical protein